MPLLNPQFNEEWTGDHTCRVMPGNQIRDVGNIFVPPGWGVWFEESATFAQPEGHDARATDPDRFRSPPMGYLLFNFAKTGKHGLYQRVDVTDGQRLRFGIYAHAWSNHKDPEGDFPYPEDPQWSEGAGFEHVKWAEGSQPITGETQQDAKSNFLFRVGIDPKGGLDPFSPDIVWSKGWHIYNGFDEVSVEAVANGNEVTVFTFAISRWPFKHNDVYWDDASLEVVAEPEPPPEDSYPYERTMHCLPQDATWDEAVRVLALAFPNKQSLGWSPNDLLIPHEDLLKRTAYVYDVERIAGEGGKEAFEEFALKYYPPLPDELIYKRLTEEPGPDPPPQEPRTKTGFHLQLSFAEYLEVLRRLHVLGRPMAWVKLVQAQYENIEAIKSVSPHTKVMGRYIPSEPPAYFLHAENHVAAIMNSTFKPAFDRMKQLGLDAIEWPINEVIGTHNTDIVRLAVDFAVSYCQWCRDRAPDVAPGIITPGGGNPDHGDETALLVPAAFAAVRYGGILCPHTYYPVIPDRAVAMRWMMSEQVQRDYHLRPVKSWLPVFEAAGVDIAKIRLFFGETGPCGANVNHEGEPGGYKDAGAGWRREDSLNGDLNLKLDLMVAYEELLQPYPQVIAAQEFTSGFVQWKHFQVNAEWLQFVGRLGG